MKDLDWSDVEADAQRMQMEQEAKNRLAAAEAHLMGRHEGGSLVDRSNWVKMHCPACSEVYKENGLVRMDPLPLFEIVGWVESLKMSVEGLQALGITLGAAQERHIIALLALADTLMDARIEAETGEGR